jgi:hypothetical protein
MGGNSGKVMGWMLDPIGMATKGKVKGLAGMMGAVGDEAYGKKVDTPATPNPQDELDKAQQAAAGKAAELQQKRRQALSRSRSIYTSPLGISGQAQTAQKQLLGQ